MFVYSCVILYASSIHFIAVLSLAEEEKKRKYNSAAEARRAPFTPFVLSTDVMLGRETNFLLKRLP